MQVINFFDPDISLRVAESSDSNMVGRIVSVGEFTTLYGAGYLAEMGDGTLYYRTTNSGEFMRGHEFTQGAEFRRN